VEIALNQKMVISILWRIVLTIVGFHFALCSSEDANSEESGESSNDFQRALATSLFLIICILLFLSTLFEMMERWLLHIVSDEMKKVVNQLFAELTVLGFISLTAFAVVRLELLDRLSVHLFGEMQGFDGGDFLKELIEDVHLDLFLVMVLFIAQTVFLIQLGDVYVKEWRHMEEEFSDLAKVEAHKNTIQSHFSSNKKLRWYHFEQRAKLRFATRLFEHNSLRKEFLCGRNLLPPFDQLGKKHQHPLNFEYSQYLAICLAQFMSDTIEMGAHGWMCLAVFLFFFFVLMYLTSNNIDVLVCVWLGLGYLLMAASCKMYRNARWRMEMHINPADVPCPSNNFQAECVNLFHGTGNSSPSPTLEKLKDNAVDSTPLIKKKQIVVGKTTIMREFEDGTYRGLVTAFHDPFYLVTYEDGDQEELNARVILKLMTDTDTEESNGDLATTNPWFVKIKSPEEFQRLHPWREETHITFMQDEFKKQKQINFDSLPGWCNLIPETQGKKCAFYRWIFGVGINRQMMLYAFQGNGPNFNRFSIRLLLFMHAIYVALLWIEFLEMFQEMYDSNILLGIYVILTLIPSIIFLGAILTTIKDTVHTNHIGCLQNKKTIAVVLRNMKLRKSIRTLVLLNKLQERISNISALTAPQQTSPAPSPKWNLQSPAMGQSGKWRADLKSAKPDPKATKKIENELQKSLGKDQYDEMSKMFDCYDLNQTGELELIELGNLMKSLGKELEEFELERVMELLDVNGDGLISKLEFLVWIASQTNKAEMSLDQIAKGIFSLLDKDKDGELTASELMDKLHKMDVGLTFDEISDLIRELDETGSGTITEQEFARLLKSQAAILK